MSDSNIPTLRFSWGESFSRLYYGSLSLQPVGLFALLSELTRLSPSQRGLLLPGFRRIGHPLRRRISLRWQLGKFHRVGIEPRRAHHVMADKVTFPRAPLQSRKVGFPDSGFDLDYPRKAFPRRMKLKRSLAYTPTHSGLPRGSSLKSWLLRLAPLTMLGPPSAQSQGGVQRHLEGRYPFFFAPASSCAKPVPSSGIRVSTLISRGPCRLLRTPAGNRFLPGRTMALIGLR
jgi:hypothetical protein